MKDMDVSKQFNRFAGKEVAVTETPFKVELKNLGIEYEGVNADYDENDPVIKDLFAESSKAGYELRVWLPGVLGTMDSRPWRLNVFITKDDDGKYRIQPEFSLG